MKIPAMRLMISSLFVLLCVSQSFSQVRNKRTKTTSAYGNTNTQPPPQTNQSTYGNTGVEDTTKKNNNNKK